MSAPKNEDDRFDWSLPAKLWTNEQHMARHTKETAKRIELAREIAALEAERDFCKKQWDMTSRKLGLRLDKLSAELAELKDRHAEVLSYLPKELEATKAQTGALLAALDEAEQFRTALESCGLDNKALADLLGTSAATVASWKRRTSTPMAPMREHYFKIMSARLAQKEEK